MPRHNGMYMYAVCDAIADDGHQCPAFVTPDLHGDPFGPGHVFAGYLQLTEAARAAGWQMDGDVTRCPHHRLDRPAAVRPAGVDEVDLLSMIPAASQSNR